ncbi:MAG TPA: acylphosphatase [Candidatus Acidoferrum sp.]|nr:acylphosphatase [Candidatus Acidoferrum sp.]
MAGRTGFVFELVRADYVKSGKRSNRNLKNFDARARLPLKHCIRRPALASCSRAGQPRAVPSTMNRCRMHIFYSGLVQGIGFRYTAKAVAAGFELVGSVRNLPDGRVELIAEGDRPELEAFRLAIRDAGLAGFIRDERVDWAEATNEFRGFEIVR